MQSVPEPNEVQSLRSQLRVLCQYQPGQRGNYILKAKRKQSESKAKAKQLQLSKMQLRCYNAKKIGSQQHLSSRPRIQKTNFKARSHKFANLQRAGRASVDFESSVTPCWPSAAAALGSAFKSFAQLVNHKPPSLTCHLFDVARQVSKFKNTQNSPSLADINFVQTQENIRPLGLDIVCQTRFSMTNTCRRES